MLDPSNRPPDPERENLDDPTPGPEGAAGHTPAPSPTLPMPDKPTPTLPMPDQPDPTSEAPADTADSGPDGQGAGGTGDPATGTPTGARSGQFLVTPSIILTSEQLLDGRGTDPAYQTIRALPPSDPHERLGGGATATVKGGIASDGKRVAVKMFVVGDGPDELTSEAAAVRAKHEWRAAQSDYGPSVVRAFACYHVQRGRRAEWLLVMNLIPGEGLDEVMEAVAGGEVIDGQTQVSWLAGGLRALVLLNEKQHELRDVKPANLRLDGLERARALPVFLDHGVAARAGTSTFLDEGTAGWTAPERLRNPASARLPKSDLFSFAAAMLDVFTGHEAFAVDDNEPTYPTLVGRPRLDDERLDPRLRETLAAALVKNPADRATPAEALAILEGRWDGRRDWDPFTIWTAEKKAPRPSRTARESEPKVNPQPSEGEELNLVGRPGPTTVPRTTPSQPEPVEPPSARLELRALGEDLSRREPIPARQRVRGRWLERFAGVDPVHVDDSGTHTLYNIVGLLLALYALYVTGAMVAVTTLAAGEVTPLTVIVGAVLGAFVAMFVISVDRSVMASSNVTYDDLDDRAKDANPLRQRTPGIIFLRVVVAVVIALVIGEAANIAAFTRDIDGRLAVDFNERVEARADDIRADRTQQQAVQNGIKTQAQTEIDAKKSEYEAAEQRWQLEKDNAFGTGEGCGPRCLAYVEEADALEAALGPYTEERNTTINAADTALAIIETEIQGAVTTAREEIENDNGLLAREEALRELVFSNFWVFAKYAGLLIILLSFELASVFIKLSTRGNGYERSKARALRATEREKVIRQAGQRELADRRLLENNRLIADEDKEFYAQQRRRLRESDGVRTRGRGSA